MNPNRILVEVCCDSLDSVRAAAEGGADRIELCRDLSTDGLTPLPGTLREAKKIFPGPVNVLIRLRPGNFSYSPDEIEEMCRSVQDLDEADGFVIGALTPDGNIDTAATRRMMKFADEKPVTFHRAFDRVNDPFRALEDVISCGCTRILTSGTRPDALQGADILRQLHQKASGRILILAGGGVSPNNINDILLLASPDEVHGSLSVSRPDGSKITDPLKVAAVKRAASR